MEFMQVRPGICRPNGEPNNIRHGAAIILLVAAVYGLPCMLSVTRKLID